MLATMLRASVKNEYHFEGTTIILNNPNAYGLSTGDQFGYSVDISENYAVVGAPTENDSSGLNSGKIYVFNATSGSLIRTFDNPNVYGSGLNDNFGRSVSVYGDIVAASAYNETNGSGKVYLFSILSGSLIFVIDNPNFYGTPDNDLFGVQLSVFQNKLIVGAYQEDDKNGKSSGKAYIFDTTTGTLLFVLDNPNPVGTSKNNFFGCSVDINEYYAVVGAYQEDDGNGKSSGKAYIFDTSNGALVTTLDNPNHVGTSKNDYFGWSVSLSDKYVVVGAYLEDDSRGSNSGKAYVFNFDGILLLTLDNPNPVGTSNDDHFGWSVTVDNHFVVVGAYQEDGSTDKSGKVYVFDVIDGSLIKTINNPNAYGLANNDYFGFSVAISGRKIIAGTPGESDSGGTSSGKAYVFY